MRKKLLSLLFLSFLFSCSNDPGTPDKALLLKDSVAKKDTGTVFVLPAPLQVATWFRQNSKEAEFALLSPADRSASLYQTDAKRALNLGVMLADIGYTGLYGDRQATLDYFATVKTLMADLRLDKSLLPMMERLEKNINQQDSLSYLVLTLYNEASAQLNESGRQKTAFFITAGGYLEGLSVTLSSKKAPQFQSYNSLVAQQKLWLDNLAESLTYLDPDDETQDLYNTLYTLQHYFQPFSVTIDRKGGKMPVASWAPADMSMLASKAVQLRDEIVKG